MVKQCVCLCLSNCSPPYISSVPLLPSTFSCFQHSFEFISIHYRLDCHNYGYASFLWLLSNFILYVTRSSDDSFCIFIPTPVLWLSMEFSFSGKKKTKKKGTDRLMLGVHREGSKCSVWLAVWWSYTNPETCNVLKVLAVASRQTTELPAC